VPVWCLARVAGSAEVERDDAMVASKIGNLAIPEAGGDRPARDEEDARSIAVVFVVQRNVVAEVEVRRRSGPF